MRLLLPLGAADVGCEDDRFISNRLRRHVNEPLNCQSWKILRTYYMGLKNYFLIHVNSCEWFSYGDGMLAAI